MEMDPDVSAIGDREGDVVLVFLSQHALHVLIGVRSTAKRDAVFLGSHRQQVHPESDSCVLVSGVRHQGQVEEPVHVCAVLVVAWEVIGHDKPRDTGAGTS